MEQNGIWHIERSIPSYMIGKDLQANITSICNILQNTAGLHARHHGLGFDGMNQRGQIWVLNRMRVAMQQFPKWNDQLKIQTWVSTMRGPFSDRHFSLQNTEGVEIGSASTFWVAVDIAKRKPVRIVESTLPIQHDKLPTCGKSQKLRRTTDFENTSSHKAQLSDLDMVGHVNNVKYIEWMLNHLALFHTDFSPTQLEVNYLSETHFNEKVVIESKPLEEGYACVVLKEDNQSVICRGLFLI